MDKRKMLKTVLCFAVILLISMQLYAAGGQDEKQAINIAYNSSFGDLSRLDDLSLYEHEVNWIGIPENELENKIKLEMITGSKSYDICITQASGARQFGSIGILAPLEPLEDWEDVFEGDRNQYSIGETIYGYPIVADIQVLYYRTDMLKEAGYDAPPATWDQFREMIIRLTIDKNGKRGDEAGFNPDNIAVWGSAFKGGAVDANPWELASYLYGNGINYIKKDFVNNTYEVTVDDPVFIETLQWVYDNYAIHKAYPPGFVSYDYTEFHGMFMEGKTAMVVNWPYMFGLANEEGQPSAGKFAVAPLPNGSINNSSPIGGWSINVLKDSENLEAAKELAMILASQTGNRAFQEVANRDAPRESLIQERIQEAESNNDLDSLNLYRAMLADLQTGQEMDLAQTMSAAGDCQKAASAAINAVFAGQVSAEEAMSELKLELEGILKKNKYMEN